MVVLVTGNLGYIGSVLTPMLLSAGHTVWGVDTGYYQKDTMNPDMRNGKGTFTQLQKDVRDLTKEDLQGVEAVVHLAALSNDPTGEFNPGLTEEINFEASVKIAKLARSVGVTRFVFASSCSIYGEGEGNALTEESSFNPLTAYARSKVQSEAEISTLATEEFSPTFLRNATAYGVSPSMRFDLVVNNLTGCAFSTQEVKLLSDGKAWRPIVHVGDIAQACLAVLGQPRSVVHVQAFNVGQDAENYQIRDIAETVKSIVPNCEVTYASTASADNRNYNVSFGKIQNVLPNFTPAWNLEKGIGEIHDFSRNVNLTYNDFQNRRYSRIKELQYLVQNHQLDSNLRWRISSHPVESAI